MPPDAFSVRGNRVLLCIALENNFIPVGIEQFHAAPTSQWNVITMMIDERDFYLLVIGGAKYLN